MSNSMLSDTVQESAILETDEYGDLVSYNGTDGHLIIPREIKKISFFADPFFRVKRLALPDTFLEFPDGNFFPNLEEITVSDDHPLFCVKDGCLIDKSSKTLICVTRNAKLPNDGSILRINDRVCAGDSDLVEIELPDSVQELGRGAFNCSYLQSIKLSSNLKHIGSDVFKNCQYLTAITLPDGLVSLGDRVFCNCTSLEEIRIPDSVENVGEHAFYNCANLKSVSFSSSTHFAPNAFQHCINLKSIPAMSQGNQLDLKLIYTPLPDGLPF